MKQINLNEFDAVNLDLLLISECGDRLISPIVEQCFKCANTYEEGITRLSYIVLSMYKLRWDKLANVYELEYNPLKNFSDDLNEFKFGSNLHGQINEGNSSLSNTSSGTNDETVTYGKVDTSNYGKKNDSTRTDNLTSTETKDLTNTETPNLVSNTYGFNSTTANPTTSNTGSDVSKETGTDKVQNTGTQQYVSTDSGTDTLTRSGSDTTERNNKTKSLDERETSQLGKSYDSDSAKRSYSRTGNIGNHTNQQLILEEINLWNWSLHRAMIDDMKDFLTLPIY